MGRTTATPAEVAGAMPGDDLLPAANVVMDRAFTVPGTPGVVWPWIAQLGKARGRWYLPRGVERVLPAKGRGLRHLDPRWTSLEVGDVVPDYGRDETFTVAQVEPPHTLVYTSRRGRIDVTWAIVLAPAGAQTRVHLRLRLANIRRRWLAEYGGGFFDYLTILGLADGLRERLAQADPGRPL